MMPTLKSVLSAFSLLAVGALLASAAAVQERDEVERRQLDGVFDSITAGVGSIVNEGTAGAASIAGDLTSLAAGFEATVTSIGGEAVTVITSAGGEAITLAPSGIKGVTTEFAGSVFTEITGDAASIFTQATAAAGNGTGNAAVGVHAFALSTVLLGGFGTVMTAGVFWGTWGAF
ncbi:hypothetical protein OH77DRAFT_1430186 [Trametes cingulata]|nr:hypothetical protein OH77DRAFT_1430186 [Trametes cingulata]